jgi:hypothetical protein
MGLASHHAAMKVQPTSIMDTPAKIRAYFGL